LSIQTAMMSDDRGDPRHEVIASQPAEEAQQPETDDEVRDEDRADVDGAGAQKPAPRLEGRTAVGGDGVDERERVGREEDEERERTRVEPVGDARDEDGRDRQPAERGAVERDRDDRRRRRERHGREPRYEE